MIKGFVLNDDLLKNVIQGNYFEELLTRIRDIRSSHRAYDSSFQLFTFLNFCLWCFLTADFYGVWLGLGHVNKKLYLCGIFCLAAVL